MIPIEKLRKFPQNQRYRKIAKELLQYEETETFPAERIYALAGLVEDKGGLDRLDHRWPGLSKPPDIQQTSDIRRWTNTLRHYLYTQVGIVQADWDFVDTQGKLDRARRRCFPGMQIFLEDVRSPFNVGSIFRTAESFGVEKVYVSPLCASPMHPRAVRSAKGCIEALDWELATLEAIKHMQQEGMQVFAMETGGTSLSEFAFPNKAVMLVGSEELGLSPEALSLADSSAGRVSIPTYGLKASLNVSSAFAIVMHAWSRGSRTIFCEGI
ncbi:MAG: TrmH family RNA methyltransferase [Spirochaetaceae bacterium]|jgi:TrmH family RNA methyltransferase|nr:TrmH family RNA methyltransferase [Spirochaetaceae bacterium]